MNEKTMKFTDDQGNKVEYAILEQKLTDFCCIAGHRCSGIDYPWNHICASVGV